MERVIKRYLMQNQGDSDDPKQNDFEELKQDLQTIRYEILNDMKKTREETSRNMNIINNGIHFVAEELLNNSFNNNSGTCSNTSLNTESENAIATISSNSSSTNGKDSNKKIINNPRYKELLRMHQSYLNSASVSMQTAFSEYLDNLSTGIKKSSSASIDDVDSCKNSTSSDNRKFSLSLLPEITPVQIITAPTNLKKMNRIQSTEEFYQDRLAYDFQTVFDED